MEIRENVIELTLSEQYDITNKGEKILKNYHSKGKCMYCKCASNAIFSHVISEKGSLSTIADQGEVGHFESKRRDLEKKIVYSRVNINKAAGFRGFCSIHDNQLFECIDNNSDMKKGNEVLLQAYRSVCKALHEEGCYPYMELPEELNFDMIRKFLKYDKAFEKMHLDDEAVIMNLFHSIEQEHRNKLLEWRNMLSDYKDSIEKDIESNFTNIHIEKTGNMIAVRTSDEKVAVFYNWFDWRIPVGLFNHHRFKGKNSMDCILNFTYIPYENSSEVYWIFSNKHIDFFYDYWKWFLAEKINFLNIIESSMMALEYWCIDPLLIDAMNEERRDIFFKDIYFNTERANIFNEYDMSIFDDIRKQLIIEKQCSIQKEMDKFKIPFRDNDDVRKQKFEKYVYDNVI